MTASLNAPTTTPSTVLITGCSSGFGLETARLFLARGWQVVATLRRPREGLLPASERLRLLPLDVTDPDSIRACVAEAGPIDTLGTLAMTQAVLPQFRQRRAGVVVNVTSSVTLKPLPLLSVYTASKAAVNAFTESVALELAPLGVRLHLVLPGRAPATAFGDNARRRMAPEPHPAYAAFQAEVFASLRDTQAPVTEVADVAEAVWRAVTDPGAPLCLPAGADAVAPAGAPVSAPPSA